MHEAAEEYGLPCLPEPPARGQYQAIVVAVGHRQFVEMGAEGIQAWGQPGAVIFDVKSVLDRNLVDGRL